MATKADIKAEATAAILEHLATVGPKNWEPLRERYSSISERTWWRLVKQVREGDLPSENVASAVKRTRQIIERVEKETGSQLPAAPSPAVIAKGGMRAEQHIDLMAQFGVLLEDIDLLKSFSSKVDDEGKRAIKNPLFFTQMIRLRRELLDAYLHAMREVWDLQQMMDFYESVVAEVAAESPAARDRIMERLAKLNAKRGMTINARV